MNRNNNTSKLTEASMIAGILVIIAFIAQFISVAMFFYPTPAIILAKRRGIKYSALALIAADLIISILLGVTTGFMFFVLYTPFSLALAYGVYKDEKASKTMMYGSAAYMVAFVVFILLTDAIMGINFVDQLQTMYAESYIMAEGTIDKMGASMNAEQLKQYKEMITAMKESSTFILANLFPAMVVVISVMAAYINYLVAEKFAKRFKININEHTKLSYFSFPKTFMVAMASMLLISYLLGAFKINVQVIQINLFNLVFLAMVLQGFAVIKFFIGKSKNTKAFKTFIGFMIGYMVIFVPGMILIVALAGLVDISIDLRKINKAVSWWR